MAEIPHRRIGPGMDIDLPYSAQHLYAWSLAVAQSSALATTLARLAHDTPELFDQKKMADMIRELTRFSSQLSCHVNGCWDAMPSCHKTKEVDCE